MTGWTHRPNGAAHVLATAVAESNLDTNRELVGGKGKGGPGGKSRCNDEAAQSS